MDVGALSLEHLRLLVIDASKDGKNMTLFDVRDVRGAWAQLWHHHLLPALRGSYSVDGDAPGAVASEDKRLRKAHSEAGETVVEDVARLRRPKLVMY